MFGFNQKQVILTQSVSMDNFNQFDLLKLHQLNPKRYPFLLESVAKGGLGKFDILFAYPQETIQLDNLSGKGSFLARLEFAFKHNKLASEQQVPDLPFRGGWFAYFSYDYAQVVEPILKLPKSEFPLAVISRVPAAIIINHKLQKVTLVAEEGYSHYFGAMQVDILSTLQLVDSKTEGGIIDFKEEPKNKYLQGVKTLKEYILSGDVFQVNLSRQWSVKLDKQSNYLAVYRALRQHNPAPFFALACFENKNRQPWQIMSSSPERLVKYKAPWVETRPIAGTCKRGSDSITDKALIDELITHPKERAEHIMLIDLERNDLGRICQPGSVEVNELMVIESYQHVHHIVSNVRGKLQKNLSPMDIIHAVFPGGTITGCPKIRCMQIIAKLEKMPREAYTGSLGYINRDGSLDFNILIRTMIQSQKAGENSVQFRAGAGIVADSEAQSELAETRYKAKGLVNALMQGLN